VAELQFGPNVYTSDPGAVAQNSGAFADIANAIVVDALAPGGDGRAETGWTRGVEFEGGSSVGEGFSVVGLGTGELPAACANAHEPDLEARVVCDFAEAAPRWSGPVAYDWPLAWATVDPVPGFRRTVPREEFLPAYLALRVSDDCRDATDDDGDGLVDDEDPGCRDPWDLSERSPELVCDDGRDNDGDGFRDFVADANGDGIPDPPGDPCCHDPSWPIEESECQDGINNDSQPGTDFDGGESVLGAGNGDPDGADPQCLGRPWRNREVPTGCGLGFELALLPPLWWMVRKRKVPPRTAAARQA
jgi:hypothetical protein